MGGSRARPLLRGARHHRPKAIEQLKQEFLAVISHELRTPLTSLQATLTLISHGIYGKLNESGEKRVRSAESGAARLIMLINDLLDIEKMEAGKLSMTYLDVKISTTVENSIEAVRGFAEDHEVTLKAIDIAPVKVLARLRQTSTSHGQPIVQRNQILS